jgi:hypothetical protein
MRVTRNRCNTFDPEVEWCSREPGLFKERYEEGTEAGVNVKWNTTAKSNLGEPRDIVDYSVGEIGSGANDL